MEANTLIYIKDHSFKTQSNPREHSWEVQVWKYLTFSLSLWQWGPSGDKKEEQVELPEGFRWKWRTATNLEGVKKGVTVGPPGGLQMRKSTVFFRAHCCTLGTSVVSTNGKVLLTWPNNGNPILCSGEQSFHVFLQSLQQCYYIYSVRRKTSQFINASRWTEIKQDCAEKHHHSLIHRQLKNFL